MNDREYLEQMKDILVRIEGTINVLHKPDVIVAHRKLQGLRDKVRHIMQNVISSKTKNVSLEYHIQEATALHDSNRD